MRSSRPFGVVAAALALMCTGLLATAQRGQPPATGTGLVAGQVVEAGSQRPISGATVVLLRAAAPTAFGGPPTVVQGGGARPLPGPVVVDSQGRFFFANVPAGAYSVQASKSGYAAVNLPHEIEVGSADRITDLKVRLTKFASLAGAVRDDGGDPVVGMTVVAFRRGVFNGRIAQQPVGVGRTDDRGTYRIANLRPGEYIVCACLSESLPLDGTLLTSLAADPVQLMALAARAIKSGADVAGLDNTLRTYPPTFSPNSPVAGRAARVKVASGEERTADVDVVAARATRVSGTILGAESPLNASSVTLWPAGETTDGDGFAVLRPMLVQPDGRFDFAGVPPGQYVLRVNHGVSPARGGGPSGTAVAFLGGRMSTPGGFAGPGPGEDSLRWAAVPVAVGEAGVKDLVVDLQRGLKVRGRIEFVGSTPPPGAQAITGSRGVILLRSTSPEASGGMIGQVNPNLTFETPGVIPGRYFISKGGLAALASWTLKSVVVGGTDVTDAPIEIDADDVGDVVVTFTDAPAASLDVTLSGGRAGTDDLSVLIFPADRKYWGTPAAAQRRFRSMPLGHSGAAKIMNLGAGEYFVAVVPDESASEWQEATQLDALSKGAQRLTLADGEKKSMEVRR